MLAATTVVQGGMNRLHSAVKHLPCSLRNRATPRVAVKAGR